MGKFQKGEVHNPRGKAGRKVAEMSARLRLAIGGVFTRLAPSILERMATENPDKFLELAILFDAANREQENKAMEAMAAKYGELPPHGAVTNNFLTVSDNWLETVAPKKAIAAEVVGEQEQPGSDDSGNHHG